ncbi:calcium-dependent protein kinase SK5-like protein [Tanacetum coccineum]
MIAVPTPRNSNTSYLLKYGVSIKNQTLYKQTLNTNFEELKEGLRRVGSELMESKIKDLMDAANINNSGTIDYGEFLVATVHLNKLEREENLVSAFSFFKKDGSGYITIDELQQACEEMGLGEVRLDEIVKEIDQDNVSFVWCGSNLERRHKSFGSWHVSLRFMGSLGNKDNVKLESFVEMDGQIDYGEFAAMMRMGNGGIGRRTMRGNLNLGEALVVVQPKEIV